jgi:hypothetical protein
MSSDVLRSAKLPRWRRDFPPASSTTTWVKDEHKVTAAKVLARLEGGANSPSEENYRSPALQRTLNF